MRASKAVARGASASCVAEVPRGLDEQAPRVAVAGFGDVAALLRLAAGVPRWRDPQPGRQLTGMSEARSRRSQRSTRARSASRSRETRAAGRSHRPGARGERSAQAGRPASLAETPHPSASAGATAHSRPGRLRGRPPGPQRRQGGRPGGRSPSRSSQSGRPRPPTRRRQRGCDDRQFVHIQRDPQAHIKGRDQETSGMDWSYTQVTCGPAEAALDTAAVNPRKMPRARASPRLRPC
jgi:hypothetical protein